MALRHTLASLPLSSLWLAQATCQQHYYTLAPPSWQNSPLQPLPVGASCSNLCWETKPEKKVLFAFSAWFQTQPLYALHTGLLLAPTQHVPNLITKVWLELLKWFQSWNNIFPFHLLFIKVCKELSVQCIVLLLQNSLNLTHTKEEKKSIRCDICLYSAE